MLPCLSLSKTLPGELLGIKIVQREEGFVVFLNGIIGDRFSLT
jgi:hypothetical protein